MVDHVRGELTELLGLRACRFDYGTLLGQPPRLRQDRRLSVDARRWDLTADGRPEGEIELRAYGDGHCRWRFMLTPGAGPVPPLQARLVAVTPADQTGPALDTAGRRARADPARACHCGPPYGILTGNRPSLGTVCPRTSVHS
ncbi:hypothetical protein [Streptomyces chiangmaiensis]|uniref:Uncharacterized protein n=1 Tax=Streptomyces chiangmaiensis TaxID=766497 RepID=A0ABU7FRI1_9ACTN|nr:hypothetical protein [Streptomyces chiangmaiensis]MED7826540.1 hypothetical protein [Streptomyces chiangmaiensis]